MHEVCIYYGYFLKCLYYCSFSSIYIVVLDFMRNITFVWVLLRMNPTRYNHAGEEVVLKK